MLKYNKKKVNDNNNSTYKTNKSTTNLVGEGSTGKNKMRGICYDPLYQGTTIVMV
jgi:hypothetical protein